MSTVDLHHRLRGEGPPVLLLHGLFGSASNLGGIERALMPDFTVISADLRNHGRSPWADRMDYQAMAEDVLRLLDRLQIPKISVFGHSMGGKTAMQLALMRPDRVERLIVGDIAPGGYPNRHDAVLDGYRALEHHRPQSAAAADEIFADHEPDPDVRSFLLTNWTRRADGELGLRVNLDAISNGYAAIIGGVDGRPFAGPTLFLKGETSDYITERDGPAIRQLFPNGNLKIIGGAGHWIHADKPDLVARLTARFLKGEQG